MKKITKLVIPVAGLGTRFLPVTKAVPKAMMPILDKPVLQYLLEDALRSGITDVCIVLNHDQDMIRDYFTHKPKLEEKLNERGKNKAIETLNYVIDHMNIHYIYQDEPLGSGHAILLAKDFIGNEPFMVMYGDSFFLGKYPITLELQKAYTQYQCNIIGASEVELQEVNKYGMLILDEGDEDRILGIVEKPALRETPSLLACNGTYILNPSIFKELEKIKKVSDEYLFTDALFRLMRKEEFYVGKTDSVFYDIGNMNGYVKAQQDAYKVLK